MTFVIHCTTISSIYFANTDGTSGQLVRKVVSDWTPTIIPYYLHLYLPKIYIYSLIDSYGVIALEALLTSTSGNLLWCQLRRSTTAVNAALVECSSTGTWLTLCFVLMGCVRHGRLSIDSSVNHTISCSNLAPVT